MADLELNPGYTVQGTPIQSLTELTAPSGTAIQHIQQSGVDYRIQAQNLLKTYLGYASIRMATAAYYSQDGAAWTTTDFSTLGSNGESYGITADKDNSKLILTKAGTYRLSFFIPFFYWQTANTLTLHRAGITAGGTLLHTYGEGVATVPPSEFGASNGHRSEAVTVYLGTVTAGSDYVFPIWQGMPPVYIRDVSLGVVTPATSDVTDNWTITVVNETPTPAETLATKETWNTTPSPDVAADPTALTTYDLGVNANQAVAEDELVTLNFTRSGAGKTYAGVSATVRYSSQGVADNMVLCLGTLQGQTDYVCSTPPVDIQLQTYALTNATTFFCDIGTQLNAVRIS